MNNIIRVGMADLKAGVHPCVITTLGLGSCVGIALYDPLTKVSGLAHIMLPSSKIVRNNQNIAKFADTGIDELIIKMMKLGADKRRMVAKLAGGAQMFDFKQVSEAMRIGLRNAEASKRKLEELKIPVLSEDTGGNFGRTVELYSENGDYLIKTIGYGKKFI